MRSYSNPKAQQGVVLFVALIALVVLMISAVALIRSTDTAQLISGNLSVKRDMTHESEQAMAAALAQFTSGSLVTETARLSSNAGASYSAVALASNPMGIPYQLLQASTSGETAAYSGSGVTYQYIIDRMCPQEGVTVNCITGRASAASAAVNDTDPSLNAGQGAGSKDFGAVYRISVRLTDPRSTQSFFQTTFMSQGS